jgi:hypothetical protein
MAADAPTNNATTPADSNEHADAPAPVVLDDVVAALRALPEGKRKFGAAALVRFGDLMKKVQVALLTRNPETEEIIDQDRCGRAHLGSQGRELGAVQGRMVGTQRPAGGGVRKSSLVAHGCNPGSPGLLWPWQDIRHWRP